MQGVRLWLGSVLGLCFTIRVRIRMKEYTNEPMLCFRKLRRWLCARTLARHAGGRGSKPGVGVEF